MGETTTSGRTKARAWRGALAACALSGFLMGAGPSQAASLAPAYRLALSYDGRLYVKVLDVQLSQSVGGGRFDSQARLRSYGVLSLFKRLDQHAASHGTVIGADVQPGAFSQQNIDGRKNRRVDTQWASGSVTSKASPPYGDLGFPPASDAQKLEAADPLTQLVRVALAGDPASVCAGAFRIFDGKQRYDLTLVGRQAAAPDARETRLGLVGPIQCLVRYRELAGYGRKKPGARTDQGLSRPVTLVFARAGQGGPWVISSLDADTPLGHAAIELERWSLTPAG